MKNLILCFDSTTDRPGPRDASNVEATYRLLQSTADDRQLTWYDAGPASLSSPQLFNPTARRWRRNAAAAARRSVVDAYFFLVDNWEPEDRIFLLGAGRGAYCARSLARMLASVGLTADCDDHFAEYALAAFALPTQSRTTTDWGHIQRLACALADGEDVAVPVHFLGLWDTLKVPGAIELCEEDWLGNVVSGRHAVAIDGGSGPFGECRMGSDDDVEEVWFRGTHCDVVGGPNAYWPLADITLDWMLDGLVNAGAIVGDNAKPRTPAPTERDALAEGARSLRFRKVPEDALVHASVDVYLRSHPDYWRRLPWHLVWSDTDWAARAERLPVPNTTPLATAVPDSDELTAVAS
ncbi:DUF2235 domain-containing protein [Mycobacterium sp. 1274761.0]|uniref:phospholipase effector Tle1 domain-containing protein n=1 Tax=Mycobacterium sp. 1274761.0 TaxID=1834077 RepID=UPI0007FCB9CF|nr:DUF2235 domain-containing protein [Mycobacterium sp. 1274761.0]OBK70936.1 hypothetical protein A5651_20290 [Mycobacterium sp. 1274761.0]